MTDELDIQARGTGLKELLAPAYDCLSRPSIGAWPRQTRSPEG
jgi:hypothetical protein